MNSAGKSIRIPDTFDSMLFLIRFAMLLIFFGVPSTMLAGELIIDDRSSGDLKSSLGTEWRLITDTVMGGVSSGDLDMHRYNGRNCLRMRGDVSTENNGGFVQIALSLSENGEFDASAYTGVELDISGNNERYNIHIRTSGLWFPWQSYRSSFIAGADWQTIRIPFSGLEAYKTTRNFRPGKLERIGLVGIGRNFHAELCLASIRFYTE